MNEIKNVEEFRRELNDFLLAVADYSMIKVILTCRSEFFEERFHFLLEASYTSSIYHMKNLKSEMSDFHLELALSSYLKFFNISVELSDDAIDFLKKDLLLLRIFCENNEGKNLGKIHDIYKDELFESYLLNVISKLDRSIKVLAMPVFFKIVSKMIDNNEFASISIAKFDDDELKVIESLVHDEIILRHELPEKGLLEVGTEYVNFTYDEIRDFIIAYFLVLNVARTDTQEAVKMFSAVQGGPASEGVTKYTYILSRRHSIYEISNFIKSLPNFDEMYSILLYSFSPMYHNDEDIDIVSTILRRGRKHSPAVKRTAAYLFQHQLPEEVLNLKIMTDYINTLEDESLSFFIDTIFDSYGYSHSGDSQSDKMLRLYTERIQSGVDKINDHVFVFILQIGALNRGSVRYWFINECSKAYRSNIKKNCFEFVSMAESVSIQNLIEEIIHRGEQ